MFKNLIIYTLKNTPGHAEILSALEIQQFAPCEATQDFSAGWMPVRGQEHGALVEAIGGHYIMRWVEENRVVPVSAIADLVEKKCAEIQEESWRVPGKKERKALQAEARLELLPHALTRRTGVWVWIDPDNCCLGLDTTSKGISDRILTALAAIDEFHARPLMTQQPPDMAMSQWLCEQTPPGLLTLGDECELKAQDETGSSVRYTRHALEIDEIHQHIKHGKRAVRLGLRYSGSLDFVLTEGLQLRKLQFAPGLFTSDGSEDADAFDGSVAICTAELRAAIHEITLALGGIHP